MEKTKLEFVHDEYTRIDTIIQSYSNRQINWMYFAIILFGVSFVYLIEKKDLTCYRVYFPYLLFLAYTLFAMDIYKIQIYQAYRLHLAEYINKGVGENLLNAPFLTYKLIVNPYKNLFYSFYSIMWFAVLVAFYIFSHLDSGFINCHAFIQFSVIVILTITFSIKLRNTKKVVLKLLKENCIVK